MRNEKINCINELLERCDYFTLDAIYKAICHVLGEKPATFLMKLQRKK